ncbi:TRAF-type domain-containing protein [Heracleum sosnowskyi]|uniref:TRAF-type domain-containing protein n=1 Tax=Heracleum sosnowskyi TaxID=360622 RepID=A0AAD8I7G1_9APIA|nr:TRAF-type domain-containing protein [Heracleum sosnowskyi]
MEPPPTDGCIERDKLEEVKEGGPMHHCNLFDAEAEVVVLEGEAETEVPEHPFDIISDFIDDFASSKRNFFSNVAAWLLSDRREDRIDDFVQEMEMTGFWMIGRREMVAQTLLKNVDFKDSFHCNKKFNSEDDLAAHLPQCRYRSVHCPNEGCDDQFSAGNSEIHDAVCPFKMLPCEQNCSEILMSREMDRHCITVCPMKNINCPFSSSIHKEAATENLKHRVKQLEELSSPEQLAEAQIVRSLTTVIKKLEEKLGPIDVMPKTTSSEGIPSQKEKFADAPEEKEEHVESSNTKEVPTQPPPENEAIDSPTEYKDSSQSPVSSKELSVSPDKSESSVVSFAKTEELIDTKNRTMQSPAKEQHLEESPATKDSIRESLAKEEHPVESSAVAKDVSDPPAKIEEHKESSDKKSLAGNDLSSSQVKKEELVDSPTKDRTTESSAKEEHPVESSIVKDPSDPPAKIEEHKESSDQKSIAGNDLSSCQDKNEEHNNVLQLIWKCEYPCRK